MNRDGVKLYREFLRTINLVFKNDIPTINAAKVKIRETFEHNRMVLSKESIDQQIIFGQEVVQFLLKNIAQGTRTDLSSSVPAYLVKIEPRHEMADNESSSSSSSTLGKMQPFGPCKVKCDGCSCAV